MAPGISLTTGAGLGGDIVDGAVVKAGRACCSPTCTGSHGNAALLVVIMEADRELGRHYADFLRLAGHRVILARDGQSGLKVVVERRPDLVLIGSGLVPLDGLSVLAVLRAGPITGGIAAVLIAPREDPDIRKRALTLGADEVVLKGLMTSGGIARRIPHWILARSREQATRRRIRAV